MDKIYVLGHKNPDTDSICSAIAYCNFKKLLGMNNCIPARLGNINKETEFVLDYFNLPIPKLVESVRTQVSDIEYDKLNMLYSHLTLKQIWEAMKTTQTKLLPIIESPEERKMLGIVSLGDITKFNMETFDENSLSKFNTTFFNVSQVLNAEVLSGSDQLLDLVNGKINIINSNGSPKKLDKDSVVITCEGVDLQKIFKANVKCIILTDGYKVAAPESYKGIILSTNLSIFCAIKDISLAVPIGQVMMKKDIVNFNESDFIDDIREIMIKRRYRSFPIIDEDNNVIGTLSRRHLLEVKNKKVILVDHNEKSQAVDGLEQSRILEIIDHHRVGDIQTTYPIYFRNEPVGCTATIIGNMYLENDLLPDKTTAGLLLSAIISDTLLFKSPTCTYYDKTMAQKLSAVAELDIEEYGKRMLNANTQLEGKSPEELFLIDNKEFNFNKYRITVSQVNTVGVEGIEKLKGKVLPYIKKISDDKGYNIVAFIITDIISGGSEILYAGNAIAVMKDLFNSTSDETTGFLPGVVSRKKQVIPEILNKLSFY